MPTYYHAPRNQRLYVQTDTSFGAIPHTGGTATVANGDCCKHIKMSLTGSKALIDRPDKLGSLSAAIGQGGRKNSAFQASMSMAGSGAAGTAPDMDPFLAALFGKAGSVSAGVSVTYALDDAYPSITIYDFRTPATITQRVSFGGLVDQAKFDFGGDTPIVDFSGPCVYTLTSDEYATVDSDGKGGLTSVGFPSEPSTPATAGVPAIGFLGSVTINGQAYTTFRTGSIAMAMGRTLRPAFGSYYSKIPGAGARSITTDFSVYDTDAAALSALKLAAKNKSAIDITYVVGATAGNIWTFALKNVILNEPSEDESENDTILNWSGKAHGTSATSKDEITLTLT